MLAGEWPGRGCEHCRRVEEAGGCSDRQYQLEAHEDRTPAELVINNQATSIAPTVLEIYFNNTCNLSCIYCGSWFSSKWAEENSKYGEFRIGTTTFAYNKPVNANYDQMLADFWQYMELHSAGLKYFQVLGGEPFYQREFDACLDFFEQHPNPELTFNIVSNLKVPPRRFQAYIDRFECMVNTGKIRRLLLTGSLDCWGPAAEYVRTGLDLAEWSANFEYCVTKPWIALTVNAAITTLTIHTMSQLIERIGEWNTLRTEPIVFSFMTADTPKQLDPHTVGAGVFEQVMEQAVLAMPTTTPEQQASKTHLAGIFHSIQTSSRNSELITELKLYLTELDRRRGTQWAEVFPWLAEVV
jgi:hypothetical protein